MIQDGCRVTYTGLGEHPLAFDDQGTVLVVSGTAAHVQWRTGALKGGVSLVDTRDLDPVSGSRPQAVENALDDSLDIAGLGTFTARQIYDEGGSEALLNAMVESGHLSSFGSIAEEALTLVEGRIRASADFHAVTSHLDETEADELVRMASAALIRDAFSPD
jgi:hypothetical protein